MRIQGFGAVTPPYSANSGSTTRRALEFGRGEPASGGGTAVSISEEAIKARIDEIVAKPAAQRSEQEVDFLQKNDQRLADILARKPGSQTADELSDLQKTGGFVNTMAHLSPAERNLYDELVAKGDTQAARAMGLVALSRTGGGEVTLPNGVTFDPQKTEVTAKNVRELFSRMFVSMDGQDQRSFEALAQYLQGRAAESERAER